MTFVLLHYLTRLRILERELGCRKEPK
jgi:hypothetical protein